MLLLVSKLLLAIFSQKTNARWNFLTFLIYVYILEAHCLNGCFYIFMKKLREIMGISRSRRNVKSLDDLALGSGALGTQR